MGREISFQVLGLALSWSCLGLDLVYSRLAQVKFSVALSNYFLFYFILLFFLGGGGVAIAVSVIMTRSHMNSREETLSVYMSIF